MSSSASLSEGIIEDFFTCPDVEIYEGTNRQFNGVLKENCENVNDDETDNPYSIDGDILTINVPAELNEDGEIEEEAYVETFRITSLNESNLTLEECYTEGEIDFVDTHEFISK